MSEQKHAPEPWVYAKGEDNYTDAYNGNDAENIAGSVISGWIHLARVWLDTPNNGHDNGARIVSCVNACVGMDDPAAEIAALRAALAKAQSDTATCCMVAGQVAKEAVL